MQFVCTALRFIPHEPEKKDTHSLNEDTWSKEHEVGYKAEQYNPGIAGRAVIKGENGYKAEQFNIPGAKNMR